MSEKRYAKILQGLRENPVSPSTVRREMTELFLYHMTYDSICDITLFREICRLFGRQTDFPKDHNVPALQEFWQEYVLAVRAVRKYRFGMFAIWAVRNAILTDACLEKDLPDYTAFLTFFRNTLCFVMSRRKLRRGLQAALDLFLSEKTPTVFTGNRHFPKGCILYLLDETAAGKKVPGQALLAVSPGHAADMMEVYERLYPMAKSHLIVEDFLAAMPRYGLGQLPYLADCYAASPDIPWTGFIPENTPSIVAAEIADECKREKHPQAYIAEILHFWNDFTVQADILARELLKYALYTRLDIRRIYTDCRERFGHLRPAAFDCELCQALLHEILEAEKGRRPLGPGFRI